MRIENNSPHNAYRDFWEWLFFGWHIVFVIGLLFGYFYYLVTTSEA